MSDTLTFTTTTAEDGALRRWDLRGPAGVVRFEIASAAGMLATSIYLHDTRPADGFDREDCEVCGGGWHDAAVGEYARNLWRAWESQGRDDAVIRSNLKDWYRSDLTTGAES